MSNNDLELIWDYHDATKHSYQSMRSNRHYLDWENQPSPFKVYSDLEPIPLPRTWPASTVEAFNAISSSGTQESQINPLDLKALASRSEERRVGKECRS